MPCHRLRTLLRSTGERYHGGGVRRSMDRRTPPDDLADTAGPKGAIAGDSITNRVESRSNHNWEVHAGSAYRLGPKIAGDDHRTSGKSRPDRDLSRRHADAKGSAEVDRLRQLNCDSATRKPFSCMTSGFYFARYAMQLLCRNQFSCICPPIELPLNAARGISIGCYTRGPIRNVFSCERWAGLRSSILVHACRARGGLTPSTRLASTRETTYEA